MSGQIKAFATVAVLLIGCAGPAFSQSNQSVYTNLNGQLCRTLKSDSSGAGSYEARCPGVGGYQLLVQEDDLRDNITVITPRGPKQSLDLWSIISPAFSSVGKKAEWRVKRTRGKVVPVALVVRFNASEDPGDPTKITSYLVVSKITPSEVCVTDKIPPGAKANEVARNAADRAASKPCLQDH
jgi:hypothetical protein